MRELVERVPPVMESRGGLAPRPRGVYMRVKRLRSDDVGDTGDPPLLRVRLDKVGGAGVSVRDTPRGTASSPLPGVVLGEEQGSCTLRFRLLPKVEPPLSSIHELRGTQSTEVPRPTLLLSVERVWNLRGCVVMDCAAVEGEGEQSVNTFPVPEKEEEGFKGSIMTRNEDDKWSLYVLEKKCGEVEKEEEYDEPKKTTTDDEFGFDDLIITQPEVEEEEKEDKVISSAFDGRARRMQRKRLCDDTTPHCILSVGPQVAECGNCLEDGEEAISLYDMLRDHGQECFLLEEDAGCEQELYIYPDHRRDDEYDSNAADFSGNEYPEEPSTSSSSSSRRGSKSGTSMCTDSEYDEGGVMRHHNARYGNLWCSEGYVEPSLDSGWNSDDDSY